MTQQTKTKYKKRPYYYSGTTSPKTHNPNRIFITVEVEMPHVEKYGKNKTMRLAYGCNFGDVAKIGMKVLCPPSRLNDKWLVGRIVSLDAGGYQGKVRYVAQLGKKAR